MRTISALVVTAVLAVVMIIPLQRQTPPQQALPPAQPQTQQKQQPTQRIQSKVERLRTDHPEEDGIHIAKINYVEQVRDMRRKMESRPHIMTIHHNPRDHSHFVEHEVVVNFSPEPTSAQLQKLLKETNSKIKRDNTTAMIIKSKTMTTNQLMKYFAEHPDSVYAEPNYLLLPNNTRPNDILYNRYQWNLPLIGLEQAWDVNRGSKEVTVAVVDTGIDLTHPEFSGKLTTGFNVLTGDAKPMDDNGHGTHCAGVIAARTNNREGIAGMSWNSKIMPIKAIGADGSGTAFDIAEGIRWATDHGADVISLSVGNYTASAALKEACSYAYKHNVVLIAASGNDATNQPSYPAAYPEVMSVGAVDNHRQIADFSNYGNYIDVVAPGVDIPSTYIYKDYAALSGTSMATPHVAALASLLRSVSPDMSNRKIMEIINQTSTDLGPRGKDIHYGNGLINVNAALKKIPPHTNSSPDDAWDTTVPGEQDNVVEPEPTDETADETTDETTAPEKTGQNEPADTTEPEDTRGPAETFRELFRRWFPNLG
ncbi:S8 family serine peptidase [Brevibacillus dissolubilis]|uniref:S8 family serine peptidase n=1 Tax=Brevibacillus dissolubilis TaxID=1844116 RepID=UPI0021004C3C|nr:S8 family serine peptidase [Brevibacillus dissolubilis]